MLATLAQSLLLLALGMMIGVPTLVIAALLHSPTGLSMTSNQASWFGKSVLPYEKLIRIIFIPSVSFSMKPASGGKLFFITVHRACLYKSESTLVFCLVLFTVKTQNMIINFTFMYFYSYVFSHFHIKTLFIWVYVCWATKKVSEKNHICSWKNVWVFKKPGFKIGKIIQTITVFNCPLKTNK